MERVGDAGEVVHLEARVRVRADDDARGHLHGHVARRRRLPRRAEAGLGAPRQPSSPGYVPVEMATGVVIGADPDAGLEMNDLPGVTNPFHGDVAGI